MAVQSSAVANEPSLAVDGGTYDCVASEVVGTKTTHSAAETMLFHTHNNIVIMFIMIFIINTILVTSSPLVLRPGYY